MIILLASPTKRLQLAWRYGILIDGVKNTRRLISTRVLSVATSAESLGER